MKLYLAGSVPKGDKEAKDFVDWRSVYSEVISKVINGVELFDPNVFYGLEGDPLAVAGADCLNIKQSDMIIVNAEEKLGSGTSMEMVVAKYFAKPVITVLPKNTHHRKTNVSFEGKIVKDWIHPFIHTFSDIIIEKIDDVISVIDKVKDIKIKSITVIDESIDYAKSII